LDELDNGLPALPEGWRWTTIGEVATVITGTTPSKTDLENYGNYLPFVKPPELKNGIITNSEDNLSEKGAKLARILPPNSILVSCIGILGKTGINSVPVAFNQQINGVIFPSIVLPKYGFYYFQTSQSKNWLNSVASATTVSIVNKSKFQKIPFPLPPLSEQQRIVEVIETHLTRLDAGVESLKRAQAGLKRYRASVLKAACEGKLVTTEAELARAENRDYEPADRLLRRILSERRARWETDHPGKRYEEPSGPGTAELGELPEGWCWGTFDRIADVKLGKMLSPKAYEDELIQIPYLRNQNVRWGTIDFSDLKQMGFSANELDRFSIMTGDLLVCEGGEPGRCSVFTESPGIPNPIMYQKALHRIRPFGKLVNPYFIQYCLWHYVNIGTAIPKFSETTIQHLPREKFLILSIPLPPLAEQTRIVAEVERQLSVVTAMEQAVEAGLARAARLRQSILREAFAGRL